MTQNSIKKFTACSLALLLLLSFGWGCEKDDICVDGDTPLLIIRFYDATDTATLKPVTSLRVVGLNREDPVNTFTDRSALDSIGIPLDLEAGISEFVFISDSADEDEAEIGNRDTVRFSYTVSSEFVSRACGFVGRYNNLSLAVEPDTLNWIQDTELIFSDIIKQDSAHVKIFH